MAAGELKIVASSDLGELGARDGPPVAYFWPIAAVAPYLVPWLAVGLLLVLPKANRRLGAWWVLLPLLCVQALLWCLRSLLGSAAGDLKEYRQVYDALSFGIAVALLVHPLFGQRFWSVSFMEVLLTAGCTGLLAFVVCAVWSPDPDENVFWLILLGQAVFWSALALSLAGLFCRRRLRPMVFSLWVLGVVVVGWVASATPWVVFTFPHSPTVPEVVPFVVAIALVDFLVLLPFLLLAFIHPFYRARLESVLGIAAST